MVIVLSGWSPDRYPQVLSRMLQEAGLPPVRGKFSFSGFEPDGQVTPEQEAAISSYFRPMSLDECRAAKRSEIAAARFEAETAGVEIDGIVVKTDRESQALITGASLKGMQDGEYSCKWKTESGFVELTALQIVGIADIIRSHVQACFDREAELVALIEAAESPGDLDKIVF